VLAFLDNGVQATTPATQPSAAPAPAAAASPKPAKQSGSASPAPKEVIGSQRKRQRGFQDVPASNMRKIIASRLTLSKVW
jgi:pyruvate/2-oxoglutarate dehydrogenase complex dihydrolipoamide acyltransferase (E2) component